MARMEFVAQVLRRVCTFGKIQAAEVWELDSDETSFSARQLEELPWGKHSEGS